MLYEKLNPAQYEAATYPAGPLLIAAGAGSGKTRTLTNRLLHLIRQGIAPEHIIAITFTNKASQEMSARLARHLPPNRSHPPFIGTFHSLGARILRKEARRLGRTPAFSIFDDDDMLRTIRRLQKERRHTPQSYGPALLRHSFSTIKNELLGEDAQTITKAFDEETEKLFCAYETSLQAQNAFDFDDLIEKPVRLFSHDEALRARYQNHYRAILVDEYQDINTAQYHFIRLLAEQHHNISVVGDDAQAIYGFRGSDFRNFLNFEHDWPKAKVVLLEENYRSTGTIIRAASAVIAHNTLQKPKHLWTKNEEGAPLRVNEYENEEQEAAGVADAILARAQNGTPHKSVGVLYRTNAQSRAIEQALLERAIPYQIFGGVTFYERMEVKDLLAALRYAVNPADAVARERIAKNFLRQPAELLLRELPEKHSLPPFELISYTLTASRYLERLERTHPDFENRTENIDELVRFSSQFTTTHEFLERASLLQSSDAGKKKNTASEAPRVHLMSMHLSKGLEFDAIYVIGCNEGIVPHHRSYQTLEEMEEERRLMYVAMTRARTHLALSFFDLGSRFLYEIPPELIAFSSAVRNAASLEDDEERYISID